MCDAFSDARCRVQIGNGVSIIFQSFRFNKYRSHFNLTLPTLVHLYFTPDASVIQQLVPCTLGLTSISLSLSCVRFVQATAALTATTVSATTASATACLRTGPEESEEDEVKSRNHCLSTQVQFRLKTNRDPGIKCWLDLKIEFLVREMKIPGSDGLHVG